MICPECNVGTLRQVHMETTQRLCYDYYEVFVWDYYECDFCKTIRQRKTVHMTDTTPVGAVTANRIRKLLGKSTVNPVEEL